MVALTQFEKEFSGNWTSSVDFGRHRAGLILHRNFLQALKYHSVRKMQASRNSSEESARDSKVDPHPNRREKRFSFKNFDEKAIREREN